MQTAGADLLQRSRILVDGVRVEFLQSDGAISSTQVQVTDSEYSENNNRLAVNQFAVVENRSRRRSDVVLLSTPYLQTQLIIHDELDYLGPVVNVFADRFFQLIFGVGEKVFRSG